MLLDSDTSTHWRDYPVSCPLSDFQTWPARQTQPDCCCLRTNFLITCSFWISSPRRDLHRFGKRHELDLTSFTKQRDILFSNHSNLFIIFNLLLSYKKAVLYFTIETETIDYDEFEDVDDEDFLNSEENIFVHINCFISIKSEIIQQQGGCSKWHKIHIWPCILHCCLRLLLLLVEVSPYQSQHHYSLDCQLKYCLLLQCFQNFQWIVWSRDL